MQNTSYWRLKARPIIDEVLSKAKSENWDEKQLRKALHDAYPFGQRRYHPYKIWLDEIQRQRGLKWPIGHKQAFLNQKKRISKDKQKLLEWEELYGTATPAAEAIRKEPSR